MILETAAVIFSEVMGRSYCMCPTKYHLFCDVNHKSVLPLK